MMNLSTLGLLILMATQSSGTAQKPVEAAAATTTTTKAQH